MRNSIIVLAILLVANAVIAGGRKPQPEPSPSAIVSPTPHPVPSPIVVESPKPEPIGGYKFTCVGCVKAEIKKVADAQLKVNEIIQSKCFGDFMLKWGLIDRGGRTPMEVIEHLRKQNLNIPAHYYYSRGKVVGYRNPPYPDIYMNRKFHDYYGVCDTASNMAHESSHVAGYDHPFNSTPTRGHTIPYAINNAFDECCVDGDVKSKGFRGTD